MRVVGLLVAVIAVLVSSALIVLDVLHKTRLLAEVLPENLMRMITPQGNFLLLIASLAVIGAVWLEQWYSNRHQKREQEPSDQRPTTNTATGGNATAYGNKIEQHFDHYTSAPPDEIAEAVVKKLQEEKLISAAGDGFIQMERTDLEVSANPLREGDTISVKFTYANRGALPLRDVQAWGATVVVDPTKNSGPHLRNVMLTSAQQGFEKFPTSGTTLGVGLQRFGYAPLSSPLTKEQMEHLQNGDEAFFFMAAGVWKDNAGQIQYWSECQMAIIPNFPNLDGFRWMGI